MFEPRGLYQGPGSSALAQALSTALYSRRSGCKPRALATPTFSSACWYCPTLPQNNKAVLKALFRPLLRLLFKGRFKENNRELIGKLDQNNMEPKKPLFSYWSSCKKGPLEVPCCFRGE